MSRRGVLVLAIARVFDVLAIPFTALAGIWLRAVRVMGLQHMPASKAVLRAIGVFPVRDHYYEPLTDGRQLRHSLNDDRPLPGIDMNIAGQLEILSRFHYQEELRQFPLEPTGKTEYCYHNDSFESGDSEYLYSIIRLFKPRRIIEIGSGHSTLIARAAIARNTAEDAGYVCRHVCIEPYEQPWLETLGIEIIRRRVEELDVATTFGELGANDILFIDSSHVIRPQGDVLFEYLEVLPTLRSGVLVHVHDIFTPKDYLPQWILGEVKLWNEQYLLEAFLTQNPSFRIIGALNHLGHHYPREMSEKLPVLGSEISHRKPGSFWMIRC